MEEMNQISRFLHGVCSQISLGPGNYFAEVEQMAFDPSNMPPGIEPSPDKMLQVTP